MSKCKFIVISKNEEILKKWFLQSTINSEIRIISINKDIVNELNKELEQEKHDGWIIVCSEGTRFLEEIEEKLQAKNEEQIYGIIGAKLREDLSLKTIDGRTGYSMIDNKIVQSLGQECIMFHSKIIKKYNLKFDERFDEQYMVDFSLNCSNKGVRNSIISIKCISKEDVISFSKLQQEKQIMREKYQNMLPLGLWGGSLTDDKFKDLESYIELRDNWLNIIIKEKKQLQAKINDDKKIISEFSDILENKNDKGNEVLREKLLDEVERKIVWVFGTPRSGSTWLAHDILRRKRIRSMDETMIGAHLGAFYDNPQVHWALTQGFHKAKFDRIIDKQEKKDLFFATEFEESWKRGIRNLILDRIVAQFGFTGYDNIVIKSPNESHSSDLIMKCLPKSKLIFLIRDGRDVIDSRQGKFHNPRSGAPYPETPEEREFRISHFAMIWNIMIQTTQNAFDLHDDKLKLFLKYEDLRADPISNIKKVYDLLGIELEESELKQIAEDTSFENIPKELKGDDKNIRKGSPGAYKEYFTKKELKIIDKIMGENLHKFGY